MSSVPARLRRLVIRRAGDRCEYCRLAQVGQEATFHIDHIVPESHGGETDENNLALACVSCSLRKEARQSGLDSHSGKRVPLFHPRRDEWNEHFRWDGVEVVGITPKGRATVHVLRDEPIIDSGDTRRRSTARTASAISNGFVRFF